MFHYAFIKVECLLDKIIPFILTQLYLECLGEVTVVKSFVWITLLQFYVQYFLQLNSCIYSFALAF